MVVVTVECGYGLIVKWAQFTKAVLGFYFETPKVFNFELETYYSVIQTSPQPYQSRWLEVNI